MKKYARPIAAMLVLAFGGAMFNASSNTVYKGASSTVFSAAANPEVPTSIVFAGTKVSFDRVDMYERMDREMASMVYGHSNMLLTIKRANKYFPMMAKILKEYGVPTDFLYLAAIESYLDWRAYSPANAAGIWQFIASTGKQYGLEINNEVDERYDPEKATIAAAKYLRDSYAKFKYWPSVAASYNAGTGKISSELAKQLVKTSFDLYLTEETSRYVFRIMAMKTIMESPKKYGFHLKRRQLYQTVRYTEVTVSGAVSSWSEWAVSNGTTYAILREMNPWIRSSSLTNKSNKTYTVRIPIETDLYKSKRGYSTYNNSWVTD